MADGSPTGSYFIKFDGDEIAVTDDVTLVRAASNAKAANQAVEVRFEQKGDQLVLIELMPATEEPAATKTTPAAPTAPAPAVVTGSIQRLPTGFISSALELASEIDRRRDQYNVITPEIAISELTPGYKINLTVVRINHKLTDDKYGRGTDTYRSAQLHRNDERALSKIGLLKLAHAVGIQWDLIQPLPPFDQQNIWGWYYHGHYVCHDGTDMPAIGTRRLDLRDGSADAQAMSASQLKQQRTFGNEICETKAMERAIRMALQLPHTFTVAQLEKPFLIPRVQFVPDMSDPDIKRMVTERALRGTRTLFPGITAAVAPAALTPPPAAFFETPDAGEGQPVASTNGGDAVASEPEAPAGAKFLAEAKVKRESKPGTPKPWKLYEIIAKTGESWTTFKEEHFNTAQLAIANGWPVRIEEQQNEKYPDQTDCLSLTVIDSRQPSLPMAGDVSGGF